VRASIAALGVRMEFLGCGSEADDGRLAKTSGFPVAGGSVP